MIVDFNDEIIDMEAKISHGKDDMVLLITESFILWYILVEGIVCESFSESDINNALTRNVRIYQSSYSSDADFNFIIGWMLSVAFWYFDPLLKEEDGPRLLNSAYKSNPKNTLFKWANRKGLRLQDTEIESLKIDIALRYDQLYNYGAFLKEYFLDIVKTVI